VTTAADRARAAQDADAETPNPADLNPGELVWVAVERRGIDHHKPGLYGHTHCGRAMYAGVYISPTLAGQLDSRPCPRCWTAVGGEGVGHAPDTPPADGTAGERVHPLARDAVPAPSPVRPPARGPGEGVTPTVGTAAASPAAVPTPHTERAPQ